MNKNILVLLAGLFALSGCDSKIISEAHEAIKDRLKDPLSAQFRNDTVYDGDTVCGELNAKNQMGGYVGFQIYIYSEGRIVGMDDISYAQQELYCADGRAERIAESNDWELERMVAHYLEKEESKMTLQQKIAKSQSELKALHESVEYMDAYTDTKIKPHAEECHAAITSGSFDSQLDMGYTRNELSEIRGHKGLYDYEKFLPAVKNTDFRTILTAAHSKACDEIKRVTIIHHNFAKKKREHENLKEKEKL